MCGQVSCVVFHELPFEHAAPSAMRVQVGGGVIEVLSTGGDANLGGDDWDAAIMRWLVDEHLKPARVDCTVR